MDILRTPDERFEGLPDWPYEPRYVEVDDGDGGGRLSAEELDAYDAPFPDETYMQGARQFPSLVPIFPDDPAIADNRAAWGALEAFERPLLTAFSDSDPVTAGGHTRFQQSVPGARGQHHVTLHGAGHFLQQDAGEILAGVVVGFCRANPLPA
jgi:haloalkane dehalogenase